MRSTASTPWSIRGPVRRERSLDCLTPTRTTSSTRSSPSGNSPQPEESTLTRSCWLRMATPLCVGNQTQLPEDYSHSRVPELWAEDQLFPSLQYFMKGAEAPLGHIAQIDPEENLGSAFHRIPQPVRRRSQPGRRNLHL